MAAAAEKPKVVRSEDELGNKWDHCLADTSIKLGSGLGLGIVFSLLFFKRRAWPIVFGTGVGLGMGYTNCEHNLKRHSHCHGKLKKTESCKHATESTKESPKPTSTK